ncbi:hypothetical protein [Streptomyces mesophilus]|uniref:hypothetical protein n=1 Tax=Streptomyces mesophilus TaxID=1775132 RepID=UPI0033320662
MLRITAMSAVAVVLAVISIGANAPTVAGQQSVADRTAVADAPAMLSNNEHTWG